MYCNHFGFKEKPFEITPDPQYLFLSPSHKETLASLVYGIRERRGFIVIVGEVGTGKTTLLNAAIDRIGPLTKVAYVYNTSVNFEQMLQQILLELGVTESNEPLSRIHSIQLLNGAAIEQLSQGGNIVIIVDEAQNLSAAAMENLRQLSNLETPKYKLIQIVLSGQPELEQKLRLPELRQLAQRISIRRSVRSLTEEETYQYLQYRLKLAGYSGSQLLEHKAQQLIYAYTEGIPRKINILCDNSLLIAYALKNKRILRSYVEESAMDLNWSLFTDGYPIDVSGMLQETYETPIQQNRTCAAPDQPKRRYAAQTQPKCFSFTNRLAATLGVFMLIAIAAWVLLSRTGSPLITTEPVMHAEETTSKLPQPLSLAQPQENTMRPNRTDLSPDAQPADFGTSEPPALSIEKERRFSEPNKKKESSPFLPTETSTVPQTKSEVAALHKPIHTVSHQAVKERPATDQPISSMYATIKNKPLPLKTIEVVVGPGDTLFNIVRRAFGTYDRQLLAKVMERNPGIPVSGEIYPGQVIRIPVVLSRTKLTKDPGNH